MKIGDYFMVSDDGGLYDTRKAGWHNAAPLRANYRKTFARVETAGQVKATLRAEAFAWPGGYPLYFITQDGAALCFKCARKEFRQIAWDFQNKASTGWRITACDVNWEDESLCCDHCSKPIESAYGDNAARGDEQWQPGHGVAV